MEVALDQEVIAPLQDRSRRSLERMLSATETLLEERDFSRITVAEIAAKAGVTPGLIYSRFRRKDDLLPLLLKRYLRGHIDRFEKAAQEFSSSSSLSIDNIVDFLIGHLSVELTEHRGIVRATGARHLQGDIDLDADERALTEKRIHIIVGWIGAALMRNGFDASLAKHSATFIFQTVSLTIQTFLLFERGQAPFRMSDTFEELKICMCAYLQQKLRLVLDTGETTR